MSEIEFSDHLIQSTLYKIEWVEHSIQWNGYSVELETRLI